MKFEVIIGNPPYNSDIHMKFVELSSKISDEIALIIPAKQYFLNNTTENNEINNWLLRHTYKLVFYQCEGELFNITLPSGVGIYFINKNVETDELIICNRSKYFKSFENDWLKVDNTVNTFNTKALKIINKINNRGFDIESLDKNKEYKVFSRRTCYVQGGSSNKSRGVFYYDDKFMPGFVTVAVIKSEDIIDKIGVAYCIASFDTEIERDSFISYINTKFVRYLVNTRLNNYSNVFINDVWRNVPKQVEFNHIFTDSELYDKYSLTQEDIEIIESVIKERNIK